MSASLLEVLVRNQNERRKWHDEDVARIAEEKKNPWRDKLMWILGIRPLIEFLILLTLWIKF